MGRIGRLLKTEINRYIVQTVESYMKLNHTAYQYGPSGDDAPPLKDDRIVLIKEDGTGKYVAAGVLSVSQGAKPGEKIMYSRDADGVVQAVIKLLNDGSITIDGSSVKMAGGGKAAARVDDQVEIEIPAQSFVVTVSGGSGAPAVGVKNATAVKCTGTIKTGSQTVEIG